VIGAAGEAKRSQSSVQLGTNVYPLLQGYQIKLNILAIPYLYHKCIKGGKKGVLLRRPLTCFWAYESSWSIALLYLVCINALLHNAAAASMLTRAFQSLIWVKLANHMYIQLYT